MEIDRHIIGHFTFPGELVHLFDKETERNLLAD